MEPGNRKKIATAGCCGSNEAARGGLLRQRHLNKNMKALEMGALKLSKGSAKRPRGLDQREWAGQEGGRDTDGVASCGPHTTPRFFCG